MKISGQFQNIQYAKYYATIRSYIETCNKNGINIIEACTHLLYGELYTLEEILQMGKENEEKSGKVIAFFMVYLHLTVNSRPP